jgi:hypothetical protein
MVAYRMIGIFLLAMAAGVGLARAQDVTHSGYIDSSVSAKSYELTNSILRWGSPF